MSSYKAKIYRSQEGCCICRAKSSSSRFTDSGKYEGNFQTCFKLLDDRNGEICNACVLIVKRWKKLPVNTTKNWAHVVDARTGPGTKNVFKLKKKDEDSASHDTFKHKHAYRKNTKPQKSEGSISEGSNRSESPAVTDSSLYPDFIDASYWKRCIVCCGVIFVGQLGEVMFDQRFYKKCSANSHTVVERQQPAIDDEEDFESDDVEKEEEMDDLDFYNIGEKEKEPPVNTSDYDVEEDLYDKIYHELDTFTPVELMAFN